MKKGWTYKKLGEVCNIIGGGTPDKKNHSFYNGLIPWATVRDMNCEVLSSTEFSITEDGLNNSASHIIKKGEIIIATRVGLGKICKLAQDTAINQDLKGIIPKKEIIDRGFLYYYFKDKAKYIESNGVGATVKGVKLKFIEDLTFPLIGIHEQKKIVERLDTAFAQIDELKANAEKQLTEARALFQKSLAKAMDPKEGWEEKTLKEITSSIGDGLHGTPKYSDEGKYYFVNGNNFEDGIIEIKENTKRVDSDEYDKYKIHLDETTVLLSINGTIGKTAFYNGEPIILGKSACYINVLPSLSKEFLRYFLLSDSFIEYAKHNSRQATIVNLGLKEIRTMPISLPPLSEQQRIVERLDSISENVRKYEDIQRKVIAECDALKQALLRQVFE